MTATVTRLLPAVVASLMLTTAVHEARAGLSKNWEESGEASWYGPRFNGKRTSSGERFDQNALTAAHDTLPLGTKLHVTVQETGRSVVVTITDRMPPKRVRIIDLSRGAAKELGLLARGTGMVTLTEAKPDDPVEVAEAPDDDEQPLRANPRRHGPRHRTHAGRRASAHR